MKNKRKMWLSTATTAAVYILSAVSVYADTPYYPPDNPNDTAGSTAIHPLDPDFWDIFNTFPSDFGPVNYLIDFFDPDGTLLDSKICQYGQKLENIMIPDSKEDEQYIYQFLGWDPQLPETVTECMAYTAVYQRIDKSNTDNKEIISGPDIQETPEHITKASSETVSSDEITHVSSTSYDVTTFHIETPAAPKQEMTDTETENTILEDPAPGPETTAAPKETKTPLTPALTENNDPVNMTETPAPADVINEQAADILQDRPHTLTEETQAAVQVKTEEKTTDSLPAAKTTAKPAGQTTGSFTKGFRETPLTETTLTDTTLTDTTPTDTTLTDAAGYSTTQPSRTSKNSFPIPIFIAGITTTCGGAFWFKDKKPKHD